MDKNNKFKDYKDATEIFEYLKEKGMNVSLKELDDAVDAFISMVSIDKNLIDEFFENFGNVLTKYQKLVLCNNILNHLDLSPAYMINFLKKHENSLDSRNIFVLLMKLKNSHMSDSPTVLDVVDHYFNMLNSNDKHEFLQILKEDTNKLVSKEECDFETIRLEKEKIFSHFSQHFNPNNEDYQQIFDVCLSSKISDDVLVFYENRTLKNLIIINIKAGKVKLRDALNYDILNSKDIVEILNYFFAENDEEKNEEIKEIIDNIINNYCSEHIINNIISNITDINEKLLTMIIPLLFPHITKSQYLVLKSKIITTGSKEALKELYNLSDTYDEREDLLEVLISYNDAELLYSVVLNDINSLREDASLFNMIKEALKYTHDDYYIVLYGINIDKSILVEYYQDTNLIIDLILAMEREKKIPDNLKEEIHTKSLKISEKI